MRTSVVLPAPFGPSRPNTIPAGTSSPAPSSATVAPKRLTTPSTRTAGTEEPRRFTPVAGPVPGSARLVLSAPRRGWLAACAEASGDVTCSLSAVMSISSTAPDGSSRQTQGCRQAGEWSSPDRGDPPDRGHTEWWRASYAVASAMGEVEVRRTTLEDV